jgi:lipopolysaccharide/colanic/teichoic acid biosynthesis glycosyltransferase
LFLVALAIMLETPGPPLFLQRRGGAFGRRFLIFKFRTMTTANDGKIIRQAVRDDPRITRLGAFLRAWSIDELPQLINVVRGEMSLVGPRPHAVAHDDAFQQVERRYARRCRARPGITGLAQVSGCRGLTADTASVRARVAHDLDYIRRWSLWLDLVIIAKTVVVLLRKHEEREAAPSGAPEWRGAL